MGMNIGSADDSEDQVVSQINTTPLVDVMLVLLIIFMITMPVLTHTVKLDLPRADNTPQVVKPQAVNLSVTTSDGVFWNEDKVDDAQLAQRLLAVAAEDPQPEIMIRGDRKVAYEDVAKVMAAVQRAGVLKLGFVTEPGG